MKLLFITTTPDDATIVAGLLHEKHGIISSCFEGYTGPLKEASALLLARVSDENIKPILAGLKGEYTPEGEVVEPPPQEGEAGDFVVETPVEIVREKISIYVLPIELLALL
jgi:uncharacterized protein YaaQ